MKRTIVVALAVAIAFAVAQPAFAATSTIDTSTIVSALKKAPVYVAVGTEETDQNTAGQLAGELTKNDNINLVMLPQAAAPSDEAAHAIVLSISKGVGNDKIIGLAVGDGNTFAAYAPEMPSGVADQLMLRAVTVSTNSAETLITFTRNVHDWQADNPTAVAAPHSKSDFSWIIWLILSLVLVAIVIVLIIVFARRRIHPEVHYKGPRDLRDYVNSLMRDNEHIRNSDMHDAVNSVCLYTEAYFNRLHPDKRYSSSALAIFEQHLTSATKVVDKYIDVVDNSNYYDNPNDLKNQAYDAISSLAAWILKSIRSGNGRQMTDFTVDTQILSATRYR